MGFLYGSFFLFLVFLRIPPEIILGEIAIVVILLLSILFLLLGLTWWVWDRLGDHGLLVRQLLSLLPAKVVELVVALLALLVLDSAALIKAAAETCPLLLYSELRTIAHVAG